MILSFVFDKSRSEIAPLIYESRLFVNAIVIVLVRKMKTKKEGVTPPSNERF
jgi:hypothetical protein